MKIALIGNMNNNFSSLCRYLLDEGYDAHLFQYITDPNHFHATADTFEGQLDGRIHSVDWCIPTQLISYNVEKIKDELSSFDFIIACGPTLAFLNKANIRVDVFIPYGSDVYSLPQIEWSRNPLYFLKRLYFRYFQLKGIQQSRLMIIEKQSQWVEDIICSLNYKGKREEVSIPMLHIPTYEAVSERNQKSLDFFSTYKQIRKEYDLMIFHQSRHSWKNPRDKVEMKGNDILFKGFKKFTQIYPEVKACIVTLEYGGEVGESKRLIKQLQLEGNVIWLPKQNRKELMMGVSMSDLVVGELYNSYNLYGVIVEGLAVAKPIMQKRKNADFLKAYSTLHPILYADDEESVCKGLTEIMENPAKYKEYGRQGQQWYIDNIVNKFLGIIKQEIEAKHER